MKTKEASDAPAMNHAELSDDDLEQVSGGVESVSGSGGCGYYPTPSSPSTPSTPSAPTESFTVPVKGEDTVHIDASLKDKNAEVKEIIYEN